MEFVRREPASYLDGSESQKHLGVGQYLCVKPQARHGCFNPVAKLSTVIFDYEKKYK